MVGYEVKREFEVDGVFFVVGQLVKESNLPEGELALLMAEAFVRPVGEYEVLTAARGFEDDFVTEPITMEEVVEADFVEEADEDDSADVVNELAFDGLDPNELTKDELKEWLRYLDLSTSGKKDELIERLEDAL